MEFENKLERLHRMGKILSVICRFVQLLSLGAAIYSAAMIAFTLLNVSVKPIPIFPEIILRFSNIPGVSTVPPKGQAMIALFAFILTQIIAQCFLKFFRRLMKSITCGDLPFTPQNARGIRRLAILLLTLSVWNLPLALILAGTTFVIAYLFDYGATLHAEASQTIHVQEEVILSFAEMVEVKSGETGQHVKRVSEYSRILGSNMGLAQHQVEVLRIASMMHDVGKLLTPTEILEKTAKLTEEEFTVIKRHVTDGERMLHNASGEIMEAARKIALEHHERWDGKGYLGIAGDNIALLARIVAVADVYDALTARRSYKEPWPPEQAKQEILQKSGVQFDPAVVDTFEHSFPQILLIGKEYEDKD